MARAGTLLDLPGDRANILGKWVELDLTEVGHYALDILPRGKEAAGQCSTLKTQATGQAAAAELRQATIDKQRVELAAVADELALVQGAYM